LLTARYQSLLWILSAMANIETPNGGRSAGAVETSNLNIANNMRLMAGELNSASLLRLMPRKPISLRASQIGANSR
jgi:hypothetical protein